MNVHFAVTYAIEVPCLCSFSKLEKSHLQKPFPDTSFNHASTEKQPRRHRIGSLSQRGFPLEVLEGQLDTYELLKAMYPDTGEEEETDDDSESIIVSSLRQWLDTGDSLTKIPQLPDNLSLSIKLHINKSGCQAQSILINVSLPLGHYLTEEENTRGDKRNHLPVQYPYFHPRLAHKT